MNFKELQEKHNKQLANMNIDVLVEFQKRLESGNKASVMKYLNSLPKDTPLLNDMYRVAQFI